MRPVDDVVIEAPWTPTPEFLATQQVQYVYHVTGEHVSDDDREERFRALDKNVFVMLNERPAPEDNRGIHAIIEKMLPNIQSLKTQFKTKQKKSDDFHAKKFNVASKADRAHG